MSRPQVIQAIPVNEPDRMDPSMRVFEYALAFVALAAAGILALLH